MNICITGALGHIGSKFIRNLSIKELDKVYLVDNFLTQRYSSLFALPSDIKYQFSQTDILSKNIASIIKDSDVVLHLAAVTDAETSFHKPELVSKINKEGLKNIANLCAEHNCSLIFPSTTSVYGIQQGLVDENCKESDLKPQSPYAESKLYGEKLLKDLSNKNNLNYVILRLGTIFGYSVGMRFHTAVNKFIWQAALGKPITVWKTALNQKRPYCDLDDAIAAFNRIINQKIFDSQIYNIVSTNLTVKDIVDAIKKYVENLNIEFVDSPIMNQLSYNVSNKKSKDKDFIYKGNLDEKVRETLEKLKNINFSVYKNGLDKK